MIQELQKLNGEEHDLMLDAFKAIKTATGVTDV